MSSGTNSRRRFDPTSSEVKDIYEKTGRSGTMVFAVVRSTLTNQKGQVVAYVQHRMMNRVAR